MRKALELVCMLEKSCGGEQHILDLYKDRVHIAAELRRLIDKNQSLENTCTELRKQDAEIKRLRELNAALVEALTISSKWALPIMERDARSPSNPQWATEEINQEKNFIVSVLAKAKEQA